MGFCHTVKEIVQSLKYSKNLSPSEHRQSSLVIVLLYSYSDKWTAAVANVPSQVDVIFYNVRFFDRIVFLRTYCMGMMLFYDPALINVPSLSKQAGYRQL